MRSKRLAVFVTGLALTAFGLAAPEGSAPAATPTAAPTPAPTPTRSDAASTAEGKALFAKVVENLGGKEKVAKIRDVHTRGEVTARTAQGEMTMQLETTVVFPDRLAQQVSGPLGRFSMAVSPESSFIAGDQGVHDLPPGIRDELVRQVHRTVFYLAQKGDDPKLVARIAGEEKVGETATRILEVSYGDVAIRWFVDPATGRILRSSHESAGPDGKTVRIVTEYSDFRIAEGFSLPHRLQVVTEDSPDQTLVLEEIQVNAGADPKLFAQPPAPTPRPTSPPPKPTSPPGG